MTLGATVALSAAGGYHALRKASRSILKAADIADQAANGNLNARILHITGCGPIRDLMHNINRLMDQTEVFTREASAAMQMAAEGEYYRHILLTGNKGSFVTRARFFNKGLEAMDARTRAFADDASQMGETLKEVVRSTAAAATELEASAGALGQTAHDTSDQAVTVSQGAETASANVAGVAAATEEFSASIGEVTGQVQRSAQMAGEAVERAHEADTTIQSLNEAAEKIGEVVALINDIASQTNLLALNATIEAARAGEAGKGFAVVANEVKSLANQTGNATEEISKQIEDMQVGTREAVEAIAVVGKTIREMDEGTTAIAGTVEEQRGVVTEISANVQTAVDGVSSVAGSIALVAGGAQESSSAVTQISSSAGELSSIASQLNDDVDAFVEKVVAGR
ncbi:MAG: methyl-accepting chemotaxis protein [Alphaproteobacteria bacterium]|nr:methyl-accepting chemotaxis protein [Alphaproteobacteria bacterium]MDP6814730.1 methyl-accepting chemotaxis protein [Alphaproteobacteria bacterium]